MTFRNMIKAIVTQLNTISMTDQEAYSNAKKKVESRVQGEIVHERKDDRKRDAERRAPVKILASPVYSHMVSALMKSKR